MENYKLLEEEQLRGYAYMIPRWLLESPREGADVQFWGVEESGIPCGAAVLSGEPGILTLQYMYMDEVFRKEGRGTKFLAELLHNAYHAGKREFRVRLIPGAYPEFEKLLNGYPFRREEERIGNFSCTLEELSQIKYFQGGFGSVESLSVCTNEELSPFYQKVIAREADLVEMPLNKNDYLADCSAVFMDQGKPAGLLLVKEDGEGAVTIPLLVSLSKNLAAPIEMMRFSVQEGSRCYPPDTVCSFAVIDEALFQALEKLGMNFAKKRQRYTIELSYFADYDRRVQRYINGETNGI